MVGGRRQRSGGGYAAAFMESKHKKARLEKDESEEKDDTGKSASDLFHEVMSQATPTDIWSEYTFFLQHLPTLLDNVQEDLIGKVEKHLKIAEVKEKIGQPGDHSRLNYKGDDYPILDSLSCHLGFILKKIISPPTQKCLLCDKFLTRNHDATIVPLHTLKGPELVSKFSWQCHRCAGTFQFRNRTENNTRIYYNIDNYGNPDMGYKFYPTSFKVNVFRCTSEEYCTKDFLASYMSDLQHSFVSAEGRSAAYNNFNRGSTRVQFFKKFLFFNQGIGGRFDRKSGGASKNEEEMEAEGEDEENTDEEEGNTGEEDDSGDEGGEGTEVEDKRATTMYELSRKKLTSAFFHHEVYSEMVERDQVDSEIFGPKYDPDKDDAKVTFQQSMLAYMEKVIKK